MVASVPELTSRSISIEGIRSRMVAASRTSPSVGAPKDQPRSSCSRSAATTAGCRWPRISGPQEPTRSRYRRPSASQIQGPSPRIMKGGRPPTAPKARTGLLTPPGISTSACSSSSSERVVVLRLFMHGDGLHHVTDLDGLDHVDALLDVAEQVVLAVQPGGVGVGDEELAAIGVGPGVRHRHRPFDIGLLDRLVREAIPGAAAAVALGAPPLKDQAGHYPARG